MIRWGLSGIDMPVLIHLLVGHFCEKFPCFLLCICTLKFSVRNIPKFKDRANWSRDTFQPMRGRACVYQQTNQNIAPVIKKFSKQRTEADRISHRFEALRHILNTFQEAYTIFLSGQRIGSHIGSVS